MERHIKNLGHNFEENWEEKESMCVSKLKTMLIWKNDGTYLSCLQKLVLLQQT